MLAYAANRPMIAARRPAPNTMLAIIGIHVAAIAVLMSAKMELPPRIIDPPIKIDFIHPKKPPPPNPIRTETPQQPTRLTQVQPTRLDPIAVRRDPITSGGPTKVDPGPIGGAGAAVIPQLPNLVTHLPVKLGPELATPASELKPPYPSSKLLSEEEAVLKLKLTIDPRGRVVAVEPVGRVDAAFLAAARRHLLAHWRYRPASEDGRAVASSSVVTLRFELDG
jgi:protein TonB